MTDATFFRVWGSMYAAATLAIWVLVFAWTCALVYNGAMFRAPCIDDVDIHAAALEKDAKAKHASFVLSAMEGVEANGEGLDGEGDMDVVGVEVGGRDGGGLEVRIEHVLRERESANTLYSGKPEVV